MFCPGETVIHQFNIPFALNEVSKVVVTYKQLDQVIRVIPITSGFTQGEEAGTTSFSVTLSQQDTLQFKEYCAYFVQLNVLTISGSRASSDLIRDETGPQQYREVM